MNQDQLRAVKTFFDRYAQTFTEAEKSHHAYLLKRDHTLRVCRNIEILCDRLDRGPDHPQRHLATAAGLLHDLGRFPQFRDFRTFSDAQSVNHALLGLEEIRAQGALDHLAAADREVVLTAVKLHNVYELPPDLASETRFVACLVRDGDKLDILQLMGDRYRSGSQDPSRSYITLDLPQNDAVTDDLIQQVLHRELLDSRKVACVNDFKLLQVSWVFDLNYAPALALAHEKRLFDTILSTLPQTESVGVLTRFIRDYIMEKISQPVYPT